MIFPWKHLEKKILRRDLILNSSTPGALNSGILFLLWSQVYEGKEEIKTQDVLSYALSLDEKDHIEFLPRGKKDKHHLKVISEGIYGLIPTFPQFINLVPSFLNHQSCLPAVQDHPLGEKWKRKQKLLSCVQLFGTHRLYGPWNSSGQNTGVGRLSLLQGIFPTQESPALWVDSLPIELWGKPIHEVYLSKYHSAIGINSEL